MCNPAASDSCNRARLQPLIQRGASRTSRPARRHAAGGIRCEKSQIADAQRKPLTPSRGITHPAPERQVCGFFALQRRLPLSSLTPCGGWFPVTGSGCSAVASSEIQHHPWRLNRADLLMLTPGRQNRMCQPGCSHHPQNFSG